MAGSWICYGKSLFMKQTKKALKISTLFLAVIFLSSQVRSQSYYPAGLGNSNLKLWLTTSDPSSIINPSGTQAANNDLVYTWKDKSGSGNNANQYTTANQPQFLTNQLNGFGAVVFQDINRFMAGTASAMQTIVAVRAMPGAGHYQYLISTPGNADFSVRGGGAGTSYTDGPNMNDWCYNTGSTPAQWINGVQTLTGSTTANHIVIASAASAQNGGTYTLSNYAPTQAWGSRGMNGNDPVYELLSYSNTLSVTQRTLLQNYEASEWGLTSLLPTSGYTLFTPPTASTYNKNLVGIGYTSNTDNFLANPSGSTDGLGFSSGTGSTDFLKTAGYLMAAHNGQANTIITNANISNVQGNTNIWNRSWYLQLNNGNSSGNVTLKFNYSDYNGGSPNATYSYGIVFNSTDGTFATGTNVLVPFSTSLISGSSVTFVVKASNLAKGYYTLVWNQFFTLPLTLQSFETTRQNQSAYLQWSASEALNSDRFEIQRSSNGSDFATIGTVNAKASGDLSNDYNFTDNAPFAGWNYYRLEMINIDGNVSYSQINKLSFDLNSQSGMSLYPNPVSDVLQISSPAMNGNISIQVLNISGQIIHNYNTAASGRASISVSDLGKAVYFIRVVTAAGTIIGKIVKD